MAEFCSLILTACLNGSILSKLSGLKLYFYFLKLRNLICFMNGFPRFSSEKKLKIALDLIFNKNLTLAFSGILWHTLAYSGILWHTLAYSCILWHTLAYSDILGFEAILLVLMIKYVHVDNVEW